MVFLCHVLSFWVDLMELHNSVLLISVRKIVEKISFQSLQLKTPHAKLEKQSKCLIFVLQNPEKRKFNILSPFLCLSKSSSKEIRLFKKLEKFIFIEAKEKSRKSEGKRCRVDLVLVFFLLLYLSCHHFSSFMLINF